MPEISVIIPCHNCGGTIARTLESVLKQDFGDYEIVVVDDGSSDDSMQTIDRILRTSGAPIRVHRQANAGVSAARNVGMAMSRGRYLLFLDGDDLLADGLLQAVSDTMKAKRMDMLCFRYTRREEQLCPIQMNDHAVETVEVSDLLKKLTYSKRDILFCSFAYDSGIIRKYDIQFTAGARYGEDWEFTTKYLAHCSSAGMLEQCGYFYRMVATSVTSTIRYSQTDAIAAAERTHVYLRDMGHPFAADFGEYMYPRAVFSVAHRFGNARDRALFARLLREYDVKDVMKRMLRNPNVDVKSRLAAAAYLIHPELFYLICVH